MIKQLQVLGTLLGLMIMPACSPVPNRCETSIASMNLASSPTLANQLAQEHASGTFDGTIIIQQDGAALFEQSFGCSDRVQTQPNTLSTISDIGSIAKTFTAAAVLHMQSEGKLQLSDTIGAFYPDAPAEKANITILQLLTHSSGLDNFHNITDFDKMDRDEAELKILSLPLLSTPGSEIAYSNAAYTLLAAIIEQRSHQPFQSYVHQNLLAPLGLSNTGFYGDEQLSKGSVAKGYGGDDDGRTTFEKELTWALIGAGGMVSTPNDMLKWFTALHAEPSSINLEHATLFQMVNPRWSAGSWAARMIENTQVIQMGGSTDYGYTALIQYIPANDIVIILSLNGYSTKYGTATHHMLSRKVIIPYLLSQQR